MHGTSEEMEKLDHMETRNFWSPKAAKKDVRSSHSMEEDACDPQNDKDLESLTYKDQQPIKN